MRQARLTAVLALFLGGCATAPLVIVSPDGTRLQPVNLQAWVGEHPLAPDQELSVQELGRSQSASFHIVQVRTKEPLHLHWTHDAIVRVERGHGTLVLGSHRLRLVPGSIVNIPRGVVHAFVNESSTAAVAFVVFSPPFDGTDIVPATEGQ